MDLGSNIRNITLIIEEEILNWYENILKCRSTIVQFNLKSNNSKSLVPSRRQRKYMGRKERILVPQPAVVKIVHS